MKRGCFAVLLIFLVVQGSGPALAQIPVHEGPGPDAVVLYGDSSSQLGYLRQRGLFRSLLPSTADASSAGLEGIR